MVHPECSPTASPPQVFPVKVRAPSDPATDPPSHEAAAAEWNKTRARAPYYGPAAAPHERPSTGASAGTGVSTVGAQQAPHNQASSASALNLNGPVMAHFQLSDLPPKYITGLVHVLLHLLQHYGLSCGPNHPSVHSIALMLASGLERRGCHQQAHALRQCVLRWRQAVLPPYHPSVFEAHSWVGSGWSIGSRSSSSSGCSTTASGTDGTLSTMASSGSNGGQGTRGSSCDSTGGSAGGLGSAGGSVCHGHVIQITANASTTHLTNPAAAATATAAGCMAVKGCPSAACATATPHQHIQDVEGSGGFLEGPGGSRPDRAQGVNSAAVPASVASSGKTSRAASVHESCTCIFGASNGMAVTAKLDLAHALLEQREFQAALAVFEECIPELEGKGHAKSPQQRLIPALNAAAM